MRLLLAGLIVALAAACASSEQPPLVAPLSGPCAGIPVIPRDQPPNTLPMVPDPVLEAEFPPQIDGTALTDVASGRWIASLCMLGGVATVDAVSAGLPPGLDLTDMRVASGQAHVDALPVTITALRLPGHTGTELIPAVGSLVSVVGGDEARFSGDLVTGSAGGKQVFTRTDDVDGSTSYLYSNGDTLFVVDGVDPSQADKILAALP